MARAKKEPALTPEERLQAALVPDWEWPYKLPKNWCWTTVGTICDGFQYGYTEKATFEKIGPHFIRITDIGDGIINDSGAPYCKIDSDSFIKYKINKDDILIARMGSVGENGLATHNIDGVFASYLIRIVPRSNAKYVCNFLQTNLYWGQISEKAQGTTRLNVNANVLKNLIIPLPPLAEQQRIVDRIESLFSKLDGAKEKAQAVVDSFETRKAAILHNAFTGELTAKWREEHGVSIDNWKTTRFDSVAAIRSNLVDPAEYQSFPHIAPDNIEKKTGVLLEYHTIAEDGVTSGKHRFYSGQILYSKIRPYLSKAVVVDFDGLCSADMYPIEAYQNARCLWYYMLSDEFLLQASTAGSRSVLPKINQKELSALTVHLPTNDREQEEIARILDELFDKEQQTKEAAEIVLDQIELMKKSILARAFRGELGTNDPSEESAVELLKRVLREE